MKYMDNEFGFSSAHTDDKKVYKNLRQINFLEDILNNKLSLKDYSSSLEGILTIFQLMEPKPGIPPEKEFKKQIKKYNVLKIYLVIDFYQFKQLDEESAKNLLAEHYFQSIKKFLFEQKDFEGQKFYDDVKELFLFYNLLPSKNLAEVA